MDLSDAERIGSNLMSSEYVGGELWEWGAERIGRKTGPSLDPYMLEGCVHACQAGVPRNVSGRSWSMSTFDLLEAWCFSRDH